MTNSSNMTISKKDSFLERLRHLRHVPGAVYLEHQYTKGNRLSYSAETSCQKLKEICGGYSFPVLKRVHNGRVIFSLASMLRENLSSATGDNGIPVPTKVLLGICFARAIWDRPLEEALWSMNIQGLPLVADKEEAKAFAEMEGETIVVDKPLLSLTKAISPSPAKVTPELVQLLKQCHVSAEEIVEVVSLVATLQLLHRLMMFYPPPYDN